MIIPKTTNYGENLEDLQFSDIHHTNQFFLFELSKYLSSPGWTPFSVFKLSSLRIIVSYVVIAEYYHNLLFEKCHFGVCGGACLE